MDAASYIISENTISEQTPHSPDFYSLPFPSLITEPEVQGLYYYLYTGMGSTILHFVLIPADKCSAHSSSGKLTLQLMETTTENYNLHTNKTCCLPSKVKMYLHM